MDVQGSKISAKCLLLFDSDILEVLVTEDDDAAFGDQEREFVLLKVVQLRELQSSDLGSNGRSKL